MIIEIKGETTLLRTVAEKDAEAICTLRNNPSINRFLSNSIEISVEDQINWIRQNKLKKKYDYYFGIIDVRDGKLIGTISLYDNNSNNECAEFGRYICLNPLQAIESELMILEFAFKKLNLKRVYCRTVESNAQVWRQHYKFGFVDIGEELLASRNFVIKKQELTKQQFEKFDYSGIMQIIKRFKGC